MIRHVTLELRREDAEACAAFYELVGFARVEPPETLRERALWLERGPTQVHLMWVDDPRPLERGHIAIEPPAYDAALAALRAAGHAVQARAEHWGAPRSYVRDPAGNLVELMAYPPPATFPDPA